MKSKKGIAFETIVKASLAVFILVIVIAIIGPRIGLFGKTTTSVITCQSRGGTPVSSCQDRTDCVICPTLPYENEFNGKTSGPCCITELK